MGQKGSISQREEGGDDKKLLFETFRGETLNGSIPSLPKTICTVHSLVLYRIL